MPDIEPFHPTFNPDGSLDIDELLTYAVRNGASDLHLANQLPPAIRIDGSLRPIEGLSRIDNEQIREMVYRILTQGLRERFEAEKELDTAHTIMGVGRFRVNLFQQRGSIGAVMRAIPHEIPPFDTLGLPAIVPSLAELSAVASCSSPARRDRASRRPSHHWSISSTSPSRSTS